MVEKYLPLLAAWLCGVLMCSLLQRIDLQRIDLHRVSRVVERKMLDAPSAQEPQHRTMPARQQQYSGFYVKPGTSHIFSMADQDGISKTDKIFGHDYQTIYAKYLEMAHGRMRVQKMFEIGLGCNMGKGSAIGASARLWRRYFPQHTEIWFAEYDEKCLAERSKDIENLRIKTVAGDQADAETLKRWIRETQGHFDLIIDDGGHSNKQQWMSLVYLFQHALKPGGLYVIEDMNLSWAGKCEPTDTECAVMVDVLSQWLGMLMTNKCDEADRERPDRIRKPSYPMLPRIKTIECAAEMCVITKCFEDDPKCEYPGCVGTNWPTAA